MFEYESASIVVFAVLAGLGLVKLCSWYFDEEGEHK